MAYKPGDTLGIWLIEAVLRSDRQLGKNGNGERRYLAVCTRCGLTRATRASRIEPDSCSHCTRQMTHGCARRVGGRAPEYRVWSSMIEACRNPNVPRFMKYGVLGIRVCKRWHTFKRFLRDVGTRPSPAHQLRRIDTEDHFRPGNASWVIP